MLILLYLYLYRKDGGVESHALSNINHAVSASTVNMSKTNSENTQQSPSSQDVKCSENSGPGNQVEEETRNCASGENSQSGGSRDKLNSDSHETDVKICNYKF
jgi:hypothetical protein